MSFLFEKAVLKLAESFFERNVECRAPAGPEETARSGSSGGTEAGKGGIGYGVTAEHLEKSYSVGADTEKTLFTGLSVKLSPGEARWLTWPSGQGKTTLLRILAGLEKPDRGEVRYDRGSLFLSMLFQEDRLCEEYSACQNVAMVTGGGAKAEEILRDLLEPDLLHKKCALLSGGEKRRAALARALAAQSDLLFLDEPFAGLDEETAARAWEAVRKWQGNRALLIASHILPAGPEPVRLSRGEKVPSCGKN